MLLPYFFHLLPFRYHLPRAQLHGSTSCTVGSCHLFDFSGQVSRSSHFIAFFNLFAFLLQALFLILSCSPLESCVQSSVLFVISFSAHISPFVCDFHRLVRQPLRDFLPFGFWHPFVRCLLHYIADIVP